MRMRNLHFIQMGIQDFRSPVIIYLSPVLWMGCYMRFSSVITGLLLCWTYSDTIYQADRSYSQYPSPQNHTNRGLGS